MKTKWAAPEPKGLPRSGPMILATRVRTSILSKTGNLQVRPGDIYLAQFPFGDMPGMKLRPVLLLTGTLGSVPEILVAYISSVAPVQLLPSDLILDPTQADRKST